MQKIGDVAGSKWRGSAELWLDPLGDEVMRCACTVEVEEGVVRYGWSFKDKPQQGSITLREGGGVFTDSWHSPAAMPAQDVAGAWGLFCVQGTYGAGDDSPDWGWRIALSVRPAGGELVLQMTNIAPWGEEARAVRMICKRED